VSEEEPTGRQRLWAALRRPGSRGQITAAVLLAVVGFASVVQVRATEADDVYAGMRQEDMLQLLNSLAAASERTENQIAELEDTRSSLRNNTEARQAALEEARRKADVLGIVVTVKDPQGAVGVDQLLNGVEELRDAGAEAIEVNDTVRVVAQTAFKDGDTGIIVGEQPLAPPYTIEAIGDPHTLTTGLNFHGGFVDLIEGQAVGGDVTIKQASTVEIASTREPAPARYSEPVEGE
jgi:uncharacterized protein YlxW (UPF0749 family)